MTLPSLSPPPLAAWVDTLQASGRYTFTREEAERAAESSAVAVAAVLRRLRKAGRIVSPRRGFHVIVPLEYRATGSPPALWFIDDLMRHLRRPYYVGLLSAAAMYGAAHQAPQVFQVVTDLPTRPVEVGRVRIGFVQGRVGQTATEKVNTPTGTVLLSTPEGTAFDLVRHAQACGGLDNVATVLRELSERLTGERLVNAALGIEVTVVQRTGYLLGLLGSDALTGPLAAWLEGHRSFPVALRPDLDATGAPRDPRWNVLINSIIEADE